MDSKRLTQLYNQSSEDNDISFMGVDFHKCMLKTIPYFERTFKYQEGEIEFKMTQECAILFKKWLYNQPITYTDLTLELGKEIREKSDYLDITFFKDIANKLFVYILTADSDDQFEYFKAFKRYDYRFKFTSSQINSLDKDGFLYALYLYNTWCRGNEEQAFTIFKHFYETYKDADSIYYYARCLYFGHGCNIDSSLGVALLKENWEKNHHSNSLHLYARYRYSIDKDPTEAIDLFKLNWEENHNVDSLNEYADSFYYRIGCLRNINKAFELYKFNWEEHKHMKSLITYIKCLHFGEGCIENKPLAAELKKRYIDN